jgi:hypothetical protein
MIGGVFFLAIHLETRSTVSSEGLALDSQGNGWITSQGNSSIYGLRPDGTRVGQFTGGGIDGPWGIAVDGEDNLWVANFGPLQPGSNFTSGRISELCGINPVACPPAKSWAIQYHRRAVTPYIPPEARCCCTTDSRCTVHLRRRAASRR